MNIKTIIWDIDGVLIWHHPSEPMYDWRYKMAHTPILDAWEKFQKTQYWSSCLSGQESKTLQQFLKFLHKNDLPKDDAETMVDMWLEGNLIPNIPAIKKLRQFKNAGYRCALGTNQDCLRKPYLQRWLKKNGLHTLPVFISSEIGAAKPQARFYTAIEQSLHTRPANTILIDDTLSNILGAKKNGWHGLHIHDAYKMTPELWEDFYLPDFFTEEGTQAAMKM
ncbi:MAG: HAD family hydrolase [Alphaproteobacteria bacterium]